MAIALQKCHMERFKARFERMSEIGSTGDGGVNRPFGSIADLELRKYLIQLAREEVGLEVSTDPIANIWGIHKGKQNLPAIALGSHHDSVPHGGRFDGPLGILVALEVIQTLIESDYPNRHPLAFVSFTAEEPNPFNLSTLGSRTVAGKLSKEQLLQTTDDQNRPLSMAITAAGGDLLRVSEAQKSAQDLFAFLELHIEQGRRLEQAKIPLGVVTGICGIYREQITIVGEANHAGTTMMEDRHDALLAGAQVALALEELVASAASDDLVGTVGHFVISPNAANIIPGRCELHVEIRGATTANIHATAHTFGKKVAAIAKERGVAITRRVILDQAPQLLSEDLIELFLRTANHQSIPSKPLFSMAGHDATHIASFTRAGMLFVPSIGGKSHCNEEFTRFEDIEAALQVLLEAVVQLDQL